MSLAAPVELSVADELDQVEGALAVAPFVVVPAEDLHEVVLGLGQARVEHTGGGVADDVAGDDGVLGVPQDPLELAVCGDREGAVDLPGRDRLRDLDGEVGERAVLDRDADGDPVELACEGGQDLADRLGGAGAGRDHVDRGRARAAQVLVRAVEQRLVVGVAVDRGQQAAPHPERLVQHLHHRRHAVGGAGGVGDDIVRVRVVVVFVDAHHDGGVDTLAGRGDHHFAGARGQVRRGGLPCAEPAGRLDDDVGAERLPGQVRRVRAGADVHPVRADLQNRPEVPAVVDLDGLPERPERRVVAQQVRERGGRSHVVDADHFDVTARAVEHSAQEVPPDPAESVDAHPDRHAPLPSRKRPMLLLARRPA